MPRKPRNEFDAGVYHVFARGNDRMRIFLDDRDRTGYLERLGRVTACRLWRTMAYCLMDNHLHLLVETVTPNLGDGMRDLQGGYAQRFKMRHGRTGHVFEGRFHATPITSDAQLQVTAAYVALNPVAAGLCDQPEQWVWSSHAAAVGHDRAPEWLDVNRLHAYFGSAGGKPAQRYAQLVTERRAARASSNRDDAQAADQAHGATPAGDWERIHSRSVSSPTRAYTPGLLGRAQPSP